MDRQRERECLGRNPPRDASSSAPASPNALGADLKEPWAEAGQGRKRRVSECGAPGKAARRLNRELDPPKGRPRPGPAPPEARPGRGARLPPRPSPGQARLPPRPGPDGGPGAPQGPTWTVGLAPPEARPGQWAQLGPRPDPGQARLPPGPGPDGGPGSPRGPAQTVGPGSRRGPARTVGPAPPKGRPRPGPAPSEAQPGRGPPHLGRSRDPLVLGCSWGHWAKLAGSERGDPKPGCPSVLSLRPLRLYHRVYIPSTYLPCRLLTVHILAVRLPSSLSYIYLSYACLSTPQSAPLRSLPSS